MRKYIIAPYLKDQLSQMGKAATEHLYALFGENPQNYVSIFIVGFILFCAILFMGSDGGSAFAFAVVGMIAAFAILTYSTVLHRRFDAHLEWLSKLPFEVHGYLNALVKYDDNRPEYIRSGAQLAVHTTIRFRQPVAEEAMARDELHIFNGVRLQVLDASTLLYTQHGLSIIGERWNDPSVDTNPLKLIAGAAVAYRQLDDALIGSWHKHNKQRLPLQKYFMKLAGLQLEPLAEKYSIRSVDIALEAEQSVGP